MQKEGMKSPGLFFLFTYGWSWSFLFSILLLHEGFETLTGKILFGIAGLGPLLGATFSLYVPGNKEEVKDYCRRFADLSLIRWKWLLIILFLPLVIKLSGILTAAVFEDGLPAEWTALFVLEFRDYLKPGFILFIFVFGPLVEEPAWRGWLQKFYLKKYSSIVSGFIVGVIWGVWHLPMFFIPGTYQYEEGFLSFDFWIWMIDILGSSMLYAWIFVNTGGSIPAAILFHFSINYFGVLIDFSTAAEVWAVVLKYVLIIFLLLKLGPRLTTSPINPQLL